MGTITTFPSPTLPIAVPSSTLAEIENLGHGTNVTTDPTDIPGMSVTFTVPAGRRIKVSAKCHLASTVAGDRVAFKITEGSTVLNAAYATLAIANSGIDVLVEHVITPSAGTHTYKLQAGRSVGTGTITVFTSLGVTSNFLLVEDITGVSLPQGYYPNGSVPVAALGDSGWIPLTLANGWVSYDNTYGPPSYRKIGNVVYIRGLAKSGTTTNGTVIATLPVGYRPTTITKIRAITTSNELFAQVDIASDGNIYIATGASAVYFSLNLPPFLVD